MLLGGPGSGKSGLLWALAETWSPGAGVLPQDGGNTLLPWASLEDNQGLGDGPSEAFPLPPSTPALAAWRAEPRDRQLAALGRALRAGRRALFLDEPFASFGPGEAEAATLALADWIRQRRVPCLWTTARPEEALLAADRIALLARGRPPRLGENPARGLEPFSAPFWEERGRLVARLGP